MNSPEQPLAHPIESRFPGLALLAAACSAALFLGVSSWRGLGGLPVPPTPDAYLFEQYARAIAEGRPYQHAAGDPPSTGSTSHSYPFVLALFYKLGAQGDGLAAAAMLFGAACFLAQVGAVWAIARTLAPRAAPLAATLMALSGHQVFAGLGGTDMALFATLALWTLAAALKGRAGWMALLLAACSWTRPEGAILSAMALAAGLLPTGAESEDKSFRRGLIVAGAAGLLAYGGVAALNLWLTGTTTFHSVLGKGFFATLPLADALARTAAEAGVVVRGILLGLEGDGREFHALPIAGAALAILGLREPGGRALHRTARPEAWWLASATLATLAACSSGRTDAHFDRYFAWFLPVGLIYMAAGAETLAKRWNRPPARLSIIATLLGWQLLGLAYFAGQFGARCARVAEQAAFCQQADALLPKGAKVCSLGGGGTAAYQMPRHLVRNLYGVESSPFVAPRGESALHNIELLQRRPDLRPDAWVHSETPDWVQPFMGPTLLEGRPVLGRVELRLSLAGWKALEGVGEPLSESARQAVAGRELVDALDLGYLDDERRLGWTTTTHPSAAKPEAFLKAGDLAGRSIAELGRLVWGSAKFRPKLRPGQPARVVWRTAFEGVPVFAAWDLWRARIAFSQRVRVAVFIDGARAPDIVIEPPRDRLTLADFREVVFDLPAEAITREDAEIELIGDFFAFGFWFYQ
jgi:hypothetical protein